ncbi:AAA-like domain-containing protein [Trichocoleus sp. FACHB-591]|uniref:AAA-like domain-containing protein n=1 Tax=Trichocoleus sp. FACHB-591 TaxID=2692872 RepID=UPI001686042E|nr:AAA-like domain-containing protein [Trichocoleus sp. FACHB-591]MBD2097012.1 AAA-like domain-containing protein [Trichocoleus sp. FACHB-591]
MSWNLVRSSTVAIATPNGSVKGTGFFISSEGHLLTCAHVVEAAGGWEQIRISGQSVNLVYLGSYILDDFAVLRVTNYAGETAAPLGLDFSPMDRFLTIGYGRADFPKGASIDGTITDINPHSNYSNLPMLRLRVMADAQQIEGGYSGSPVFDAETQRVIGIVAAYDHKEGALAVPLQTVQEKWSGLKQLIEPAAKPVMTAAKKSAKVFISYRSRDPDLTLAQEFYEALKQAGHQPFMAGASIRIGETWSHRIDQELQACDYFLLLLSEQSAVSEMVTEEVRHAKELHDERAEPKPILLPIRVNFPISSPLNYDLRGYLQRIQQREWRSPDDTPVILQEILSVLGDETPVERVDELDLPITPHLPVINSTQPPSPVADPELPDGSVDLASTFYVERPPIEARCYEAIAKPGALIRIKAPRQMGKTSLMARILHQAGELSYLTVPLSFQLADGKVFKDLDLFLRWFCVSVGRRLQLSNKLADYWDEVFGSKDNCTVYFEEYLLANIDKPLTLGLDEADLVFQYPEIAADFFGLLRAWHEDAKNRDIWKKLRLIVVHSTEVYIPMNINQSPFNVGLPIGLPELNAIQVHDLSRRHGLNWTEIEVKKLMFMIEGHPYLVRVALYHIARNFTTLETLLKTAPTEAGLYGDHLRRHLWNLEQNSDLVQAMKRIVATDEPVQLESLLAFQLNSMGLVHLQGNEVYPRNTLYRQYFHERLRTIR